MTVRKRLTGLVRWADFAIGRASGPRTVLVDARTPMNFAVLAPMAERLQQDPRIRASFSAEHPAGATRSLPEWVARRVRSRDDVKWQRFDLCIDADAWNRATLLRCRRRVHFFHGMAGKYDLDCPTSDIGLDQYDRVAFVNRDRMRRYLEARIVDARSAVLVGFPKADALVNGRYDRAGVCAELGLAPGRRSAIYAPTWSPASSLHLAGRAIVDNLVASGFNVIIKLHDRSLDLSNEKYSGGVDWRHEFADVAPGRVALVDAADASPLLAASDVMVTDHSSIGFEFCLLDRPLIVFDAPDLARVARINPQKQQLLRSAARVVCHADDVGPAALEELAHLDRRSAQRRAVADEMFYEPGTATDRALAIVYELLELPLPDTGTAPVLQTHPIEGVS